LILRLPLFVALAVCATATAAPDLAPVRKWIAQQQDVRTIQADFVQTKALRTLRSPVTATGRFWFRAPASFRWQLGEPPRTIVLSTKEAAYSIQPAKKTAEKSSASQVGEKAQQFGLMSLPMAASFEDFQRNFEIQSVKVEGAQCRLEGLPRDAQARRYLAKIVLIFDTGTGHLLSFEAITREGSSLRNEFRNVVVNGKIDDRVFDYDLNGYKVTNAKP
jgi:outer membrane lipoprotein carrier protein